MNINHTVLPNKLNCRYLKFGTFGDDQSSGIGIYFHPFLKLTDYDEKQYPNNANALNE